MIQNATLWRMVQTTEAMWLLPWILRMVRHAWNGQHCQQQRGYRPIPIQIRVLEIIIIAVTRMVDLMEPGVIGDIVINWAIVTSASQNLRALVGVMCGVLLFFANNCLVPGYVLNMGMWAYLYRPSFCIGMRNMLTTILLERQYYPILVLHNEQGDQISWTVCIPLSKTL